MQGIRSISTKKMIVFDLLFTIVAPPRRMGAVLANVLSAGGAHSGNRRATALLRACSLYTLYHRIRPAGGYQ